VFSTAQNTQRDPTELGREEKREGGDRGNHLSKRMGCLSEWLVSSASIQKLFCGICTAFK